MKYYKERDLPSPITILTTSHRSTLRDAQKLSNEDRLNRYVYKLRGHWRTTSGLEAMQSIHGGRVGSYILVTPDRR